MHIDSGYESEENYLFLETNNQIAYIKPQTYAKWKKEVLKNDISKCKNMKYDAESDLYIYHDGGKLYLCLLLTHGKNSVKTEFTLLWLHH